MIKHPNPLINTVRKQVALNTTPDWRPYLHMLMVNRHDAAWIEFVERMMDLSFFDQPTAVESEVRNG